MSIIRLNPAGGARRAQPGGWFQTGAARGLAVRWTDADAGLETRFSAPAGRWGIRGTLSLQSSLRERVSSFFFGANAARGDGPARRLKMPACSQTLVGVAAGWSCAGSLLELAGGAHAVTGRRRGSRPCACSRQVSAGPVRRSLRRSRFLILGRESLGWRVEEAGGCFSPSPSNIGLQPTAGA